MSQRRILPLLGLVGSLLAGCGAYQALGGGPVARPTDAAPSPSSGAPRWVLIQNLRYGATMAEPEYVWVREDSIPSSATTFVFGKKHVLAPPDAVKRYSPAPEGGQITPVQGGPPLASRGPSPPGSIGPLSRSGGTSPAEATDAPATMAQQVAVPGARSQEAVPRGYIVHVQAPLIVVDLTAADGIQKGSLLSVRRERVPLKHPVTGEHLGEMDEEIGSARVVELRERFSVAEIQETRSGFELRVKDRVAVKSR